MVSHYGRAQFYCVIFGAAETSIKNAVNRAFALPHLAPGNFGMREGDMLF
jgi:hypothetical protein